MTPARSPRTAFDEKHYIGRRAHPAAHLARDRALPGEDDPHHDVFITLEGRVTAAVEAGAFVPRPALRPFARPNLRGACFFTLSGTARTRWPPASPTMKTAPLWQAASPWRLTTGHRHSRKPGNPRHQNQLGNFRPGPQSLFSGVVPLLPDPTRSANFAHISDPSTPSKLLEMGCLANPLDESTCAAPCTAR